MNKPWITVEIFNHAEQVLMIQPTPEFDGIELYTSDIENKEFINPFYINKDELPAIIEKLQEMINYIKTK